MGDALVLRGSATLSAPVGSIPPDPDFTTGLRWKLTADSLALANGASVPSWPASGGSNPITVNGSTTDVTRQPTYKTGAVNGHASVVFNASALQYLRAGTMPGGAIAMPATMYAVAKILDSGTVLTGFGTPYLSIRGATYGRISAGAGNSTTELNSAGTVDAPGPFIDGGFHVAVVVYNGANSAIYIDGREPVTGNLGVPDTNARLTGLGVGVGPGGNTQYLTGEVAEGGVLARALTANDVAGLILSLKTKYALTF